MGGVRVAISRGVPRGERDLTWFCALYLSDVNFEIYI